MVATPLLNHTLQTYLVTLKCSDRFIGAEFADVNQFIGRAGGEAVVAEPVNVERWSLVEGKLLLHFSTAHVPHHGRLVHTTGHDTATFTVPFESEDGSRMAHECCLELSLCRPESGYSIVGASR